MLDSQTYRQNLDQARQRVQVAIDKLDHDEVECEFSHGTLTLLVNQNHWVISAQPPVQQLWLAVASRGTAYHFSYHPASQSWRDEKNHNNEFFSLLSKLIKQETDLSIEF